MDEMFLLGCFPGTQPQPRLPLRVLVAVHRIFSSDHHSFNESDGMQVQPPVQLKPCFCLLSTPTITRTRSPMRHTILDLITRLVLSLSLASNFISAARHSTRLAKTRRLRSNPPSNRAISSPRIELPISSSTQASSVATMAHLDSVLSFSRDDKDRDRQLEAGAAVVAYDDNGGSSSDDDDDAGFEFAFAPPLARGAQEDAAPADDLFAHGRILPAYPVFERAHHDDEPPRSASHQITAPPSASADTYCAWAPRSAPGSPARGGFPPTIKSASTGEARRFWRLPGLGGSGRSHSDGKEKFVFLQPGGHNTTKNKARTTVVATKQDNNKPSSAPPPVQQEQKQNQKQSKKKGKAGAVTEMDMATAHRRFYGNKQGAVPGAADRKQHSSYLPYRTGIVGFFATAHALGKSHHPY